MNEDILIRLFKFYAKFVPKPVLKKMFVKNSKQLPGYNEIAAEVQAAPETHVIKDIDAFVFSANEEFLSKKMKNQKGTVLYVEYGAFRYTPNREHGVKEKIALHVAHPYSATNNDNLNETLLMSRTHSIITYILDEMEKEQNSLGFCGDTKLVEFPAEIVAIDPPTFFDRIGWMGIFDFSTTNRL